MLPRNERKERNHLFNDSAETFIASVKFRPALQKTATTDFHQTLEGWKREVYFIFLFFAHLKFLIHDCVFVAVTSSRGNDLAYSLFGRRAQNAWPFLSAVIGQRP